MPFTKSNWSLLESINSPADVRKLNTLQLNELARQRNEYSGNVADNGELAEIWFRGLRGTGKNAVQVPVILARDCPIRFDDQLVLAVEIVSQQPRRDARATANLAHAGSVGSEPREAVQRGFDQALPAFARC